jgi:predicted ATP-dependent endonuclease of OLD family
LQVFEQLADENQIIYATHSLFLLNQNFPERHRLIFKSEEGTKVDQKPYRQNWQLATDALGVYLSSNILFSNRVLLVEGDSDPLYLYELFRQLNRAGEIDVDLNTLGIMSFYDYQNLRFLLQIFKREGQDVSVFVVADGDSEGKLILRRVGSVCKKLGVATHLLPEGKSIEDFCLFENIFLQAIERTLRAACEAEGKPVPENLKDMVNKSWEEHKAQPEKTERRVKMEKGEKDEKEDRKTAGRWFKDVSEEIIKDEASKVFLARTYIELCREMAFSGINPGDNKEAKALCQEIISKLGLPGVRAIKTIERTT